MCCTLTHVWPQGIPPRPLPRAGLGRRARAFLLRLRTDCARTAERLFRLSGNGSPSCAQCPAEETLEHILLQCPGYDDQRRQLFGVYGRLGLPHDNVDYVIKAACVLHNFLSTHNSETHKFADTEDSSGNVVPGQWRQSVEAASGDSSDPRFFTLKATRSRSYSKDAAATSDLFAEYFCGSAGEVPWQWKHPGVSKEAARKTSIADLFWVRVPKGVNGVDICKELVKRFSLNELKCVQDFGAGRYEVSFANMAMVERFLAKPVLNVGNQEVWFEYRGIRTMNVRVSGYPAH
ncbi:hypothetical protein MTO96_034879 [Rhipicephalus appendiculatus]